MPQEFPFGVDRGSLERPDGELQRDEMHRLAERVAHELVEQARACHGEPEEDPLWIAAGELCELCTGDTDQAFACYSQAIADNQAPPAALQGLRRLARRAGRGLDKLGALYEFEEGAAETPTQAVKAAIQHGLWLIWQRTDQGSETIARILSHFDTQDCWIKLNSQMVLEDLALKRGDSASAAQIKESRWELARQVLDGSDPRDGQELAQLAASVGVVHRYLTDGAEKAAHWYRQSFDLVPRELLLRELVELAWGQANLTDHEEGLARLCEQAPTSGTRARAAFELGMLKAYRRGDREGAAAAFFKGMQQKEGGASLALPFLQMARSGRPGEDCDDVVDALGLSQELSATPRERADSLYLMAVTFERDMHLADAAIDVLQDALTICPDHQPAAKALGRLYTQRSAWTSLVALLEDEIERQPGSRRSRMKLAEVLMDRLGLPDRAETQLEAILEQELYPPAVNRLVDILTGQGRWQDLFDFLCRCANREPQVPDRLFRLEQASQIAESRLHRLDLAVDCWRMTTATDRRHPTAQAHIRRLLSSLGHYKELVQHNREEIASTGEPELATRLWTETGEIHERYLFDEDEALHCFSRALQIDPTYEPALEAAGRILWRTRDWDALSDIYEAEIAALVDSPRRQRRLLDLGELQTVQAGRPEAALTTFKLVLDGDPGSEEALLWLERIHEMLREDGQLLDIVERRQALLGSTPSPALALKAGSIAEWALDKPGVAWDRYLCALGSQSTRQHALGGLWRLWPAICRQGDRAQEALQRLVPLLREESDPDLCAMMAVLVSRLERAEVAIEEYAQAYGRCSGDPLVRAACEVQLACEGNLDGQIELRQGDRLGSLWSLMARMDSPVSKADLQIPERLPRSPLTTAVLAELDVRPNPEGDPDGDPIEAEPGLTSPGTGAAIDPLMEENGEDLTGFRQLVRWWTQGTDLDSLARGVKSIPGLRLLSQVALSEGSPAKASRFAELEASEWSGAVYRQECLLKAAELRWDGEPRSASRLYRMALDCGCHDQPSRHRLYDSLWSHEQFELLIGGLEDHLAHPLSPRERIKWLKRLASAQEHIGKRGGAIDSLRAVIALEPNSAPTHLDVVRLLTLEGNLNEARDQLLKALEEQYAPADRLMLLSRRADLEVMEGGDGKSTIVALEEASSLTGNDREWMRRLARAHAAYGDPDRSMMLLTRSLPSTFELQDLPDWHLLARLKYSHLDDRDGARELLWGLMEQFPEDLDCLKELEIYHRTCGGASELAERLSTFLVGSSGRLTPAVRSFLWEYLGDLNYHVLRRNRDAQLAFESASAAKGLTVRLALKTARAVGQQPGKGREACARYAWALKMDGVGVSEWLEAVEDLEAIFDGIEDPARVRVIRQLGGLLNGTSGSEAAEGRIKRDPARRIEVEQALEKLADNLIQPGSLAALKALEPLFEKCFGDRRAHRRELGGRRIRSTDSPQFAELLQRAGDTLGGATARVYSGNGSDQPEWLYSGGYWIPTELFDSLDEPALRFWAGHFAAAAAIGLHAVTLAQPGEIETILEEVKRLHKGGEVSRDPLLREVAAPRFKMIRETAAHLMEREPDLAERASRESWASVPYCLADRFGLLMAGDVRAAVDSILALERNPPRLERAERIVRDPRTRRILEYALSYAYQELRYLTGLSARPRLL